MLQSNQKTSLLVPSQLPAFIRENPNYANFVLFLQAYYEWMEQQDNVTDVSKNLLNYHDIDALFAANTALNGTSAVVDEFINYFQNDFLSYFPKDILANPVEVIKLAKQLYQSKGTPASYQFLFRVLYNTEVDFFITGDAVLKASAGTWYVPVSLSLQSNDTNFLSTTNLRIFGLTSKSIATIEKPVFVSGRMEIFISDVERLFQSGEFITILDSNNQIVYFLNSQIVPTYNSITTYNSGDLVVYNGVTYETYPETVVGIPPTNTQYWVQYGQQAESLTAKIIGQISQININPNYRGLYYQPGDPVIIYGGLANVPNPQGAVAQVGTVTSGSIQKIDVITGGYGYTNSPNTLINITNAPGAIAVVGSLNPSANGVANVAYIPTDDITLSRYTTIGNTRYSFFSNNISSNANTTLANAFTFTSFSTYPISSVIVENGGGGISVQPTVSAESTYKDANNLYTIDLSSLGILAPIQISNAGVGYRANDTIVISGGTGLGAYANVLTVNSSGAITNVGYVYNYTTPHYPLGGMGYNGGLPTLTVNSANTQAANASLYVPGILGTGATFSVSTNRTGSITTINISNYGLDYVTAPNVSLKVQDIIVTGLNPSFLPKFGDVVYQGTNVNTASYVATVNSTTPITNYANSYQTIYSMRVFNYTSIPKGSLPLVDTSSNLSFNISTTIPSPYSSNVISYGDGTALASATFLNGLTIGQGQYLSVSGQPSGFDVLQSSKYNNFTYEITLEKEIAKYKSILLGLLHPAGTQVIGRIAMKSNSALNYTGTDGIFQGYPLYHYTGTTGSTGTITGSFANPSSNTITFSNLAGAEIQNFIFANNVIVFTSANGDQITSTVASVSSNYDDLLFDSGSEDIITESGSEDLLNEYINFTPSVTLTDSIWTAFNNVAYGSANAGSNVINISQVWTSTYNVVNDGYYSNTMYPLMDIIRAGDTIFGNNQTQLVSNVNYRQNIIYLNGNLANSVNGNISVSRTWTTSNIQIFGPLGIIYVPELTTEDGRSLTDEQNNILVLG
jgi:hypothetical protein